jgi:hypothetical protein
MSASGSFHDKKNSIMFTTDINLPSGEYSVKEYSVDIDNLYQSAANNGIHKVFDIVDLLKGNTLYNGTTLYKTRIEKNSGDISYPFLNNQNYRILYEIYIDKKENGVVVDTYKLFHIQEFRYYEIPVALSDFQFNSNVQAGDTILVTGLNLVHHGSTSPIDLTLPETVEFKFQEAELTQSSNKQLTERYIARLPYQPSGNYTLPPNLLTNGKVYKVDVEAQWALGFLATQRSSSNLYILSRPQIADAGIDVKGLSVHDPDNVVVSINMNALVPSGSNAIPSKIWFEFYDYNNLHTNVNGAMVTAKKSNIRADSNNIIEELDQGWRIINTGVNTNGATGGRLPKVNLYYYGNAVPAAQQNSSNSFQVSQINGMGAYVVINQHQGAKEYPFVIAYTTPTASGNKASWYKSKLFYAPQASGDTVADSSKIGLTLFYTGTDDSSFHHDIPSSRRVQLALLPHDGALTNANSTYATELVNLVSLQTSSNASTSQSGNFNFTLFEAGLETSSSVLSSLSMNFNSNILVARTGGDPQTSDANGNPTSGIDISGDLYSLKLNQIEVLSGGGILIDNQYSVKALVRYPGLNFRSSDAVNVTFDLVKPSIANIVPYDVQNDGGNDGVFHPDSTDVDTSDQIIATVAVDNVAYELYAPSMIKFNIYNLSETQLAETNEYTFKNSLGVGSQLYNIKLNEVTLLGGAEVLTNGTPYRVKAAVRLLDHDSTPNPEWRLSSSFTSVQFNQNVAPVSSVAISNSWVLATDNVPSSSEARFNASPLVGVSGYFMKTAQFGSVYSKQLDVSSTRFRIEYQLNNSANWILATRAALGQKLISETMAEAADRVGRVSSLVSSPDGEYANVFGSGGLGTDQEKMVFYIPQDQGVGNSVAFTESNTINVRITVVAAAGLWVSGVSASTPTVASPNPLQVIKKVDSYDPAVTDEPWNNEIEDLLHLNVEMNGAMVTAAKSNIRADSNNIIEELDQGWRVVNTDVNTNGATGGRLPKVNLYYYGNAVPVAQQNSSNSFQVSQINGMGAYVVINQHQGAKEYPFFVAYTTPTASGNKASWYKSKLFYAPQSSGDTVADSSKIGLTLLYTGTDDSSFRPDIPSSRRVQLALLPHDGALTNANSTYDTELVNLVSLQTSSNASTSQAGNFNFTLFEAGLKTSSSVLSSFSMKFTKMIKKLFLNIPVQFNTVHAHSVKVGYKYDASHSYVYKTFDCPTSLVSLYVDPNQGTSLHYSVAYVVNNLNLASDPKTTEGLTVSVVVPNKYFPVSSDYTVTNSAYKTFNTHSESSVLFDLALAADSKNRLDGVNVYFTSPTQTNGSGINKVRIGSYVSSGSKTITLLNATGGFLKVINASGSIINSASVWGDYDLANISFEAFRDARVTTSNATYSSTSNVSDPVLSNFYVESGRQSNFGTVNRNPVWNVPVLTRPASDASGTNKYVLSGGVINTTRDPIYHYIKWPTASDANSLPFTYDLKLSKNILTSSVIDTQQNLAVNTHILPIDLNTVAEYTIEITKVFNGNTNQRELSPVDSIVFSSIQVHTNNMYVEVENPSNTSSVTIGWLHPAIERWATTFGTFDDNIYAHHIQYRTDPSNNYVKLDSNSGLIENPAPGPSNIQKLYTLPIQTLGTVYEFVMYVEAQVKFKINNVFSSDKSLPYPVPLTPVTNESKYIVSTVPSVLLPHSTPVLVQGSSRPTLLLDLNAKGLEQEGFISVVVILTQDGTPAKPDGEQALLIFPDPNSNHPFSSTTFANTVTGISGAGSSDVRLAGGDTATSYPKNIDHSVMSTQNSSYSLKIGAAGTNGRYSLSTLTMPSTTYSDFVANVPVNYMVILTTRRGTDIAVGEFTYLTSLPAVQDVGITSSVVNGETQYTVNFVINPA